MTSNLLLVPFVGETSTFHLLAFISVTLVRGLRRTAEGTGSRSFRETLSRRTKTFGVVVTEVPSESHEGRRTPDFVAKGFIKNVSDDQTSPPSCLYPLNSRDKRWGHRKTIVLCRYVIGGGFARGHWGRRTITPGEGVPHPDRVRCYLVTSLTPQKPLSKYFL